jgi:hypothetical protein
MKLELCIVKEKTSIIQINISGNYKIVIDLPEVCFGIKRQYTKVGCKYLFIFSNKNHLSRFCRNGQTFL